MKKLNVYFENQIVGVFIKDEELVCSFTYSDEWLKSETSFPLSIAMPLDTKTYGNKITLSFFENLLPEGEARRTIEQNHSVQGAFDFLAQFGHDCAGAFVITSGPYDYVKENPEDLDPIPMKKIYTAIREREPTAEVIAQMDPGYLSLAGAQDKFPAVYKDQKLFLPRSGSPTTHIIKTPIWRRGVKESVYNEYYCMQLASRIGLHVPNCFIIPGEYPLFAIERYDRILRKNKRAQRIHQQDFCQAQGFISENKYEAKGGPTLKQNYDLIIAHVAAKKRIQAINQFIDWICFNLLIGNNDCHSKNISLLMNQEGKVELAPMYDLMCTAIYPNLQRQFAFQIGGRDDFSRIGKNQFELLEKDLGLKKGVFRVHMENMIAKVSLEKEKLAAEIKKTQSDAKIVARISEIISDRCKSLKIQKAV